MPLATWASPNLFLQEKKWFRDVAPRTQLSCKNNPVNCFCTHNAERPGPAVKTAGSGLCYGSLETASEKSTTAKRKPQVKLV